MVTAAKADVVFDITFYPVATVNLNIFPGTPPSAQHLLTTGTIVTDGTCVVCSITQNSIAIVNQGIDSISVDPFWGLGLTNFTMFIDFGAITFDTATDVITGSIGDRADTEIDFGASSYPCSVLLPTCLTGPDSYFFRVGGDTEETGTYVVTPEVSSWMMLVTCIIPVLILGKRHLVRQTAKG